MSRLTFHPFRRRGTLSICDALRRARLTLSKLHALFHIAHRIAIPALVLLFALIADPAGGSAHRRAGLHTHGMVVCDESAAAEAGAAILRSGGNAIDAAVATAFALTVTYPWAAPIGGGGFVVVHLGDGKDITLDFRETAPALATRDMYLDAAGGVLPEKSLWTHAAVATPGTVDGLLRLLADHGSGRVSRAEVLRAAIGLAESGFELGHDGAARLNDHRERLSRDPDTRAIFTHPEGRAWRPEDRLVQKDLSRVLSRIAEVGRDGFYSGPTAEQICAEIETEQGMLRTQDLIAYRSRYREPVRGSFRGHEIVSMGPPSSGGVFVIQLLLMFDALASQVEPPLTDSASWNGVDYVHALTELERRAYADRAEYLGDPEFWDAPVERLLDPAYAASRVADIAMERATPSASVHGGLDSSGLRPLDSGRKSSGWKRAVGGNETTHLSVTDAQGNAVAMTVTINSAFGSGIVPRGTGILLNNEMDDFSAKPGVPNQFGLIGSEANAIAPGKRPLSSMSPTIVLRDGVPVLVLGSPGGSRIITSVFQVILNQVAFGMPIGQAVLVPRVHAQWLPDQILYEPFGLSREVMQGLEARGHRLVSSGSDPIGKVNAIAITTDGFYAGPDVRGASTMAGF